jgi:hypothetical protein
MVGPPTKLATVTWHLGRRKPEAAEALAAGREQLDLKGWDRFRRYMREHADEPPKFSALAPIDASGPGVAFVPLHLERRAAVLRLAAPAAGQGLRVCTSLGADAMRAALAGLGHVAGITAWIPKGDAPRRMIAQSHGFGRIEELNDYEDHAAILQTPATRTLALLQGCDLEKLRLAMNDTMLELCAAAANPEGDPGSLAALAIGLAKKGALNLIVSGPPELKPLLSWIESCAAQLPDGADFPAVSSGAPQDPERYPKDRWCINYLISPAPGAPPSDPTSAAQAHRARRLIGAGVPVVQFELPSIEAVAGELMRWQQVFLELGKAEEERPKGDEDGLLPADHEAALRDGPLAIYAAAPSHAYILRKVAGTLGKKAETSLPAWIAAQAAMGDSGEYVSLHWLGLPTREAREALAELQRTMSGPNQLAVRVSFSLPELDGVHPLAGASPRGLFFILSDGGGSELAGSRRAALGAEERTLALLANAGRRAILLRAEDGDASKLIAALKAAGQLLTA